MNAQSDSRRVARGGQRDDTRPSATGIRPSTSTAVSTDRISVEDLAMDAADVVPANWGHDVVSARHRRMHCAGIVRHYRRARSLMPTRPPPIPGPQRRRSRRRAGVWHDAAYLFTIRPERLHDEPQGFVTRESSRKSEGLHGCSPRRASRPDGYPPAAHRHQGPLRRTAKPLDRTRPHSRARRRRR